MAANLLEGRRPTLDPARRRTLILAAIAIVAITASLLVSGRPGALPTPTELGAASPSAPGASPASPTARAEDWAALDLEPFVRVANLTPSATDAAGVRPDATFALESLTGEAATDLAKRLEIVPETAVQVAAGSNAAHATLTPAKRLAAGVVYRFTLREPGGTLSGSWAFRVRGPLRVVGTLPGNRTTGVPLDSGIEVTFDQEDAGDVAPFFSISPDVDGRFERHGRTQVFVPASPLDPATTYTVTVKAGLPRTGTDLALERDVTFRFETEAGDTRSLRWIVGRDVIEAGPSEAPVIGLIALQGGEDLPIPSAIDFKVYAYASEAAAADALEAFLAAPRWTDYSGPTLRVTGLSVALEGSAPLEALVDPDGEPTNHRVLRFPSKLNTGWYAVEIGGERPAYAFLQVTRMSAWVSVMMDRTVLWVNDVVSQRPIAGATAAVRGDPTFGTSDSDGVLNGPTPASLLPAAVIDDGVVDGAVAAGGPTSAAMFVDTVVPRKPSGPAPLVVVRHGADTLLLAFDAASDDGLYRGEWWEEWATGDQTYWSLLFTDRGQYRTTDTVSAWGFLRLRDRDAVPGSLELRLVAQASSRPIEAPPVASARVEPDAVGVYSVKLTLDRVPLGSYDLVAIVDGRIVSTQSIEVTVLRKPDYQLAVSTDHLAVVAGSTVRVTTQASFFDGTPVPGVPLWLGWEDVAFGPTDASGTASVEWVSSVGEDEEAAETHRLSVSPAGPESGEIYSHADVVVFPASEQLDASGTLEGDQLRVTATLRKVNLTAVERQLAASQWDGDPGGTTVAGQTVNVKVTELVPIRTKVGTRYDFIEKVVVPIYRYDTTRKVLERTAITSDADGRIVLRTAVPARSHQYEIAFSTKDPSGRTVRRTTTIGAHALSYWADEVRFTLPNGGAIDPDGYGVGEDIAWTMATNAGPLPTAAPNRYLYIVAQRGLVSVVTSDSPTFRRTFRAGDAPGIFVMGVRYTGSRYAPKAASWADFDASRRRIDVTVTAERKAYRPGEDITLRVRTIDQRGDPVAADVVLQAVDEKLYAMGAAFTPDPLSSLYARVDSGIVRLTSTHQVPTDAGGEGEGGDTGGEGDARTDFRDLLAFVRLRTGSDGTATTTITASDDLTSWHIAASALTSDLRAGVGELLVSVGLPLFANVSVADEYLLSDRPAVRLRAFGTELRAGDAVTFTVSSPSLGLASTTIKAEAYADTWVELPALHVGRHQLDVAVVAPGRTDAAGKPLRDRLVAAFDVVDSRLTAPRSGYGEVGGSLPDVPRSLAATYTFSDAGRGRYLPVLESLVASTSVRFDSGLAGSLARALLEDAFGWDPALLPPDPFDIGRYAIEGPIGPDWGPIDDETPFGIDLLPYGGADPWLATRVAIADPSIGSAEELRWLLRAIRDDLALPPDLRIAAVAGLASLGDDVFADVAALRSEDGLSALASIHVGLAAAGLGDETAARSIERDLAARYGQRLGPWVRLAAPGDRDDTQMTALFALLAARVGDPLAPAMLEYVQSHPSTETSTALETVASISAVLARAPASGTSFAWSVDGKRTVVDLEPGESFTMALTGPQRATLVLEPIEGLVGVAVVWRETTSVSELPSDATIGVARTTPATAPADRLVTVDLRTTFTRDALDSGCYQVIEHVPSGLVALSDPVTEERGESIIWPDAVVGQDVIFCVPHDRTTNPAGASLRYVARVVSTGTFTWQPAVMTLEGASEIAAVTDPATVRIAP